jgi:hypothetical protein
LPLARAATIERAFDPQPLAREQRRPIPKADPSAAAKDAAVRLRQFLTDHHDWLSHAIDGAGAGDPRADELSAVQQSLVLSASELIAEALDFVERKPKSEPVLRLALNDALRELDAVGDHMKRHSVVGQMLANRYPGGPDHAVHLRALALGIERLASLYGQCRDNLGAVEHAEDAIEIGRCSN